MPVDTQPHESETLTLIGYEWAYRYDVESRHLVTRYRVEGDDAVESWCGRSGSWLAASPVPPYERCYSCQNWLERQIERRLAFADEYAGVLQLDPDHE